MLVFDIHLSHGSVATRLMCGGMFHNDFIANLSLSLSVKVIDYRLFVWLLFIRLLLALLTFLFLFGC